MILSGDNGKLTIPGVNIQVSASLELAEKDASGFGSSTANVDGGNKAKKLNINGTLPFAQADNWSRLLSFAEAKNSKGERLTYGIVDDLAALMRIRKVKFSGSVNLSKNDSLDAYNFSFVLKEVDSVSERKERQQSVTKIIPKTKGVFIATGSVEQQVEAVNHTLKEPIEIPSEVEIEEQQVQQKAQIKSLVKTILSSAQSGNIPTSDLVKLASEQVVSELKKSGVEIDDSIIDYTIKTVTDLALNGGSAPISYNEIIEIAVDLTKQKNSEVSS